ncbi:hypothetical protein HZH68_011375 [Vespula germanica]|uniref:Uncharacterized protein n=1 Tax=Vespula germanica TaxID=30212 RepID=A0A834N0E6_VESGE|nr:hypothetical protein HZH68_011375 [Vespula germanica]
MRLKRKDGHRKEKTRKDESDQNQKRSINQFSFFFLCTALSEPPMFAEPIPNVTVALGRDVSLPCVVENLGSYKVIEINYRNEVLV